MKLSFTRLAKEVSRATNAWLESAIESSLQLCSCSASERTAAPPTEAAKARAWERCPFPLRCFKTAFISTWKVRDYFPIPSRSTDGKSYAIRQECATLPFLQLSSTQERANLWESPTDIREGGGSSSTILQFHRPSYALIEAYFSKALSHLLCTDKFCIVTTVAFDMIVSKTLVSVTPHNIWCNFIHCKNTFR